MPAPTFTDGTVGNVINGVSLAHGSTSAALVNIQTDVEGQFVVDVQSGGTAPTVGTAFSAYKAQAAYSGGSPNLTLTSAVTANTASTTLAVASTNSTTGLRVGEQVALIAASSLVGEMVTIASISGGNVGVTGNGTNSGTLNNYAIGDYVFVVAQTPVYAITPTIPAANKGNSAPVYLGPGRYIISPYNQDSAQTVTVTVTKDLVPAFA